MSKQFIRPYDSTRFKWFVVVGDGLDRINRGGTISFRHYTDHAGALGEPGRLIEYITSKGSDGKALSKFFVLDESRRRLQVRETDKDMNGVSQYEFLKNYPECEGSPNGHYIEVDGVEIQQGVIFRELDSDKDADVALEAEAQRTKAKSSAFNLDDKTMQEIAANIGFFGSPGSQMRLTVLEFAEKRPADYFKLLNAGDRNVRAIVRKAIADGLFTVKGSIIYWETTVMGADENEAVARILKDEQILNALQNKVDLGTEAKSTAPVKNKGGRPKGSTNKKEQAENSL